jgi:hypothetical protein
LVYSQIYFQLLIQHIAVIHIHSKPVLAIEDYLLEPRTGPFHQHEHLISSLRFAMILAA